MIYDCDLDASRCRFVVRHSLLDAYREGTRHTGDFDASAFSLSVYSAASTETAVP
jgi:hypothetical protein